MNQKRPNNNSQKSRQSRPTTTKTNTITFLKLTNYYWKVQEISYQKKFPEFSDQQKTPEISDQQESNSLCSLGLPRVWCVG